MAKFAVSIAAVAVLAGACITAAAAVDEVTGAAGSSIGQGGESIILAADMGRGRGSQGGEAGSGGARHGGGGARGGEAGSGGARHGGGGTRGGEAGWHGNRGNWHHGGDHNRHQGHHRGHHGGRFHGSHFGFGLALGAPFWWGHGYYDYPYYAPYSFARPYTTYYYEPALIRYVERDPGYRYYCTEPAGFYPEVQNCPKAWLKVVPEGGASTSPPPGYTAPPGRQ